MCALFLEHHSSFNGVGVKSESETAEVLSVACMTTIGEDAGVSASAHEQHQILEERVWWLIPLLKQGTPQVQQRTG